MPRQTPPSRLDGLVDVATAVFIEHGYRRTLARNRRRVKLADRAALDWPELAALWFEGARQGPATLPLAKE